MSVELPDHEMNPSLRVFFLPEVTIVATVGPTRVVTGEPDPDFVPRPAGFVIPTPVRQPVDPLRWEGDDS